MKPLSFNTRVMRFLVLWPDTLSASFLLKHFLVMSSLLINPYFMAVGAVRQLTHLEDIVILLDHVIGLGSVVASVYMAGCFIKNVATVKRLVEEIQAFEGKFGAGEVVKETEEKVQKYSKGILLYGVVGNLCYALFPLVTRTQCEEDRHASELSRQRDPCGLVVRVWYHFNINRMPHFYIVFCLELYICLTVTIIVLAITMVLVGLLMYAVALLKDCGSKIRECCNVEDNDEKRRNVRFCVRYHIAIILSLRNDYIMATDDKLLQVNMNLMRLLNMWPKDGAVESKCWRRFKDVSPLFSVISATIPIVADFLIQAQGKYDDVMDITENLTALGALFGTVYLQTCFIQNRERIMKLVKKLKVFEEFSSTDDMLATEEKAALYTKVFIFYGIFGNLCYLAVPYTNLQECKDRRAASTYSRDIPCGVITRFWLPFHYQDTAWLVYLLMLWQLIACLTATFITLSMTMFLVALLMQVIAQMQRLRNALISGEPIGYCVRYHIMIIEYSKNVTQAFSSMMLMHITLTSFEISVLGFEVLMVNSRTDSLRFGMHLFGWLVLLYLICFYGQKLIDESTGIGLDAYSTKWYNSSVEIQKDLQLMILRSQKPLTLSAASLGVMSLETYLGVMSTAYSYFTLLLNMKED